MCNCAVLKRVSAAKQMIERLKQGRAAASQFRGSQEIVIVPEGMLALPRSDMTGEMKDTMVDAGPVRSWKTGQTALRAF